MGRQMFSLYPGWIMVARVPKEPITLAFDPVSAKDMGVLAVFRDAVARTFWLLIKSGHITDQHFPGLCLRWAEAVRRNKPATPEELFHLLKDPLSGVGLFRTSYEDWKPLVERIFEAVCAKPSRRVKYEVVLPGSPKDRKRKRALHKEGYDHGLAGIDADSEKRWCKPYSEGYQLGLERRSELRAKRVGS